MTILAVVGKTDKRVLAYPLMKTCGLMGKTCVITDDVAYRRLYSGTEDTGTINDVKICIRKDLSEALAERTEMEEEADGCDYLLYLTENFIPNHAQRVIALCSQNRTFCGDNIEGLKEDDEEGRLVFATITLYAKSKNYWGIPLTQIIWKPDYLEYTCETEERRMLMPVKDKVIDSFLCEAFADTLKLKPANMKKIMNRKMA